jgi:MSHA biogenesis protein MshK
VFKMRFSFYLMFSLIVCGSYCASIAAAQDPTRPPSWMTGSTAAKTSKKLPILQQILISENRKSAVINGKLVSEGEMVAGAKLININRDWVTILRSGRRITLRLVPITKESINE